MDAVNYFSSEKSSRNITAMALIIKSSIVANLANFYYKLFGSKIPTRLFSCELQAKEWIKLFISLHNTNKPYNEKETIS